jgi:hypothetical protein
MIFPAGLQAGDIFTAPDGFKYKISRVENGDLFDDLVWILRGKQVAEGNRPESTKGLIKTWRVFYPGLPLMVVRESPCGAQICESCAMERSEEVHLCPVHWKVPDEGFERWREVSPGPAIRAEKEKAVKRKMKAREEVKQAKGRK